ncbi:MAG: GAF domain-containing protein, partial [Nitrospinales bacterium]
MNSSKILKHLVQLTSNVTNAFTTALYTADHLNQTLTLKEHHTLSLNFDEKAQIPFSKGLIGNVAVERKVSHSDHLYGEVPRLPIYKKKENLKCILIFPVVFDDLEGVLVLDSKESHSFSAKMQKIVAGFAEQIAWHLHMGNFLETGSEGPSFPYHEMIQFSRSLSEPLDRGIITKRLLRFIPSIIKCDAVAVVLFDANCQTGKVAGHQGWEQELADLRVLPGKSIAGSTAKNRIPLISKIADKPKAGIFSEKEKTSNF